MISEITRSCKLQLIKEHRMWQTSLSESTRVHFEQISGSGKQSASVPHKDRLYTMNTVHTTLPSVLIAPMRRSLADKRSGFGPRKHHRKIASSEEASACPCGAIFKTDDHVFYDCKHGLLPAARHLSRMVYNGTETPYHGIYRSRNSHRLLTFLQMSGAMSRPYPGLITEVPPKQD